ncbi:MAG: flagellin [Pseudomonadota bacterium]
MGYSVILTSNMASTLYSLQQIDSLMATTNNNLATGKCVNSALDDPINYFASEEHLDRAEDLQNRKDEMSEAIQLITAANDGVEALLDLIDSIQSLANSALTATDQTEVNSLETQFNDIMDQMNMVVDDSYYKGTNLLAGVTETLDVFFNPDGTSKLTLTGEDASTTGLGVTTLATDDWWDAVNGAPDKTAINASLDELVDAKVILRTMAKTLSLDLSTIEIRQDFTSEMITALNDGASNLVSADTNAESATLLMLQTQQSLAINSLSIASDSYQAVLQLFS